MAETKTGGQRRTGALKSPKKRTSAGKPSANKSGANKSGANKSSASKSNGASTKAPVDRDDETTQDGAEEERESVLARVASQAKAPAMAGAAAAGVMGAVALSRKSRRGGVSLPGVGKKRRMPLPNVSMPSVPKPHVPQLTGDGKATRRALGATARAVGSAAVEVGKAGYRVGELTAEIRQVREQARQDQD
jgi:hypothetical protein